MEVNSRRAYLNIYGGASKEFKYSYTSASSTKIVPDPVQVFSIPAGVSRHIFSPPQEPRNISFHPAEFPRILRDFRDPY